MRTFLIIISALLVFPAINTLAGKLDLINEKSGAFVSGVIFLNGLPEQFIFGYDDPLNGTKKVYYPNGKIMKEYNGKRHVSINGVPQD